MDPRVLKLDTPEKCKIFAKNAADRDRPDLALQARQRAVQLLAEEHDASSVAERESLQAIYAYEELLTKKNGRKTRASRTWQMIKRYGLIPAVERAVNRPEDAQGFTVLAEMGLEEFAFEAVVDRHPDVFSAEVLAIARRRLGAWRA